MSLTLKQALALEDNESEIWTFTPVYSLPRFCFMEVKQLIGSPVFQSRPIKKHQRDGKQELLMDRWREHFSGGPNHLYKNKLRSVSARCHPYLMSNVKSVHSPLSS